MRIAALQHDIVWDDRDADFARLAPQVAAAVAGGAELVLLTETFSTGFSMTPGVGELEGGPSAQFLAAQAAEHGIWVGGSCPEIAPGEELPYNFTHAGEHERFRAGEKPVSLQIGGLRGTGRRCCRPARSRTMPTSSGATGSAPPATAPSTSATAGSSARWASCWPRHPGSRRS